MAQLVDTLVTATSETVENIPGDNDISDDIIGIFDRLWQSVANEFEQLTIQTICDRYKIILDEFYELSSAYRSSKPIYNKSLTKFVREICKIFSISQSPMLVYPYRYTTHEWGNVYWAFLHYSSILVAYAFEMGLITDFLDFPTLVYNVDAMLPCNLCIHHYQQIKETEMVRHQIKSISFGASINGVMAFHNVITENVDKTPEYINRPKRPMFTVSKFAQVYNCMEGDNETIQKSYSYKQTYLDWQPKTHNILAILLMTHCPQSYSRTSNLLKRALYHKNRKFAKINLKIDNFAIVTYTPKEHFLYNLSPKQIMYCLSRSILLHISNLPLGGEHMKMYNESIVEFYENYSDIVRDLLRVYENDKMINVKNVQTLLGNM